MLPELELSPEIQEHRCALCRAAKQTADGWRRCARNKLIASTRSLRKKGRLFGICHLGITEHLECLRVHGTPVGIFYVGQAVQSDLEALCESRILAATANDPRRESLIEAFHAVPRLAPTQLREAVGRLRRVLEMAAAVIRAEGVPLAELNAETIGKAWSEIRRQSQLVRRALVLVDRMPPHELSVARLAAVIGCSREHLSRAFIAAMDVGLGRYILLHRLELARHLLRRSSLAIGETALRCGFSDSSHLSARFRREYGVSPTAYRRRPESAAESPPTISKDVGAG
jgi:AraC-like DNA-binding protein/ligand-binding sensor protein